MPLHRQRGLRFYLRLPQWSCPSHTKRMAHLGMRPFDYSTIYHAQESQPIFPNQPNPYMPKPTTKTKSINFRLTQGQADAFEEKCLANEIRMSKVLRSAISQYLCSTKANDTHQPNLANGG
jgi:hypothetical protein